MRRMILAAAVVTFLAAAGCGTGPDRTASGTPNPPFEGDVPAEAYVFEGEPGDYGGTLVLSQPSDMKTFNVILASETSSNDILWYHVHRCLIDFRNGDNPPDFDPGLCTRYESSPDARQWTFYLRKGVRWSDGAPFTADDVVFTYDVIRDLKNKEIETNIASVFEEGRDENGAPIYPRLEKLDDYTVRFTLNNPNGGFLDAVLNLYLIPKHKWEGAWMGGRFGDVMKVSDDPADVVSLGPFRIKERVADQRVVLERNPYFWKVDRNGNRLPYLDRVVFVFARDFNTILAKFQAGEIDAMYRVRAEEFSLVKKMEGPDVIVEDIGVTHDTNFMVLNQNTGRDRQTGKPLVKPWLSRLFRDTRFRQAVSYAIDREGMANTIYYGRAEPLYSFVTPADRFWHNPDIARYPFDPDKSRALLAEIGLKDGNGDGVLEDHEGHPIEFNIVTNTENNQRVSLSSFIARNLQDVGIKASSTPMPLNVVVTIIERTHNFEAIVLGWQTGVPPGPTNSLNIVLSSAPLHVCFPTQSTPSTEWQAQLDQLMYAAQATPDQQERKRLYGEVQRVWSEQLPEVNLVAQKEAVAFKSKFGNIRPSGLPPRLTWNVEEIYVRQ